MFIMHVRGGQLGENNPNNVDEKYEIHLQEMKLYLSVCNALLSFVQESKNIFEFVKFEPCY
jgi:hypothetical protein